MIEMPPLLHSGIKAWRRPVFALLLAALAMSFGAGAANAKYVAFVIGNNDYQNVPKLRKARADAEALRETLEKMGYVVTLAVDVNGDGLALKFDQFLKSIEPGDTVLFHFSGHGVEIDNANYLLPINVPSPKDASDATLKRAGFELQHDILERLRSRNTRALITIIDACRDNPYAGQSGARSIGGERGLGRVDNADSGEFLVFSAESKQAAFDELSPADAAPTSVFMRSFLNYLPQPMAFVNIVKDTQKDVMDSARRANKRQIPQYVDKFPNDLFLMPQTAVLTPAAAPPAASSPAAPPPAAEPPGPSGVPAGAGSIVNPPYGRTNLAVLPPAQGGGGSGVSPQPAGPAADEAAWRILKDTKDVEQLRRFIAQFPGSPQRRAAEERLRTLEQPAVPSPSGPPSYINPYPGLSGAPGGATSIVSRPPSRPDQPALPPAGLSGVPGGATSIVSRPPSRPDQPALAALPPPAGPSPSGPPSYGALNRPLGQPDEAGPATGCNLALQKVQPNESGVQMIAFNSLCGEVSRIYFKYGEWTFVQAIAPTTAVTTMFDFFAGPRQVTISTNRGGELVVSPSQSSRGVWREVLLWKGAIDLDLVPAEPLLRKPEVVERFAWQTTVRLADGGPGTTRAVIYTITLKNTPESHTIKFRAENKSRGARAAPPFCAGHDMNNVEFESRLYLDGQQKGRELLATPSVDCNQPVADEDTRAPRLRTQITLSKS